MTQIIEVKPDEFGLDVAKAQQINNSFLPKIQEGESYLEQYAALITGELTPELCEQASTLRKKLVKVRTGIKEIHRVEKDFYLNAGRYVDALKNKLTLPIEQMEEKLSEIENHFAKLEADRLEAIRAERWGNLSQYLESEPAGLATMQDIVFDNLLSGAKAAHVAKVEAELQAEKERIAKEKAEAEERERIRVENERLKKEAEAKEAQMKAEREEAERKLAETNRKAEEERKAVEENARIERERIEADNRKREEALRAEQEKLKAELAEKEEKEKADREAKEAEENARIAAEKKAQRAPDKEKLLALAKSFEQVEFPALSTPEAAQILANITELRGKLVSYITEKAGAF